MVAAVLLPALPGPAGAQETGLPVPTWEGNEVRRAVEDVLARREFDDRRSLVERARDWLVERVLRVWDGLAGTSAGTGLGWAAAGLLLVVAVVAVVRFTRPVQLGGVGGGRGAPAPRRPAEDWQAEAVAHEAEGDWRAGLRCRYRALVADLAARGVVEEVPGRTAGEYRRQVGRAAPALAGDFGGATELFEAAWYGDAPVGPGDGERFRRLADQVLSAAGR